MATTARKSPKQIAAQVIADNGINYVNQDPVSAMMLAIAAYTDASNQRQETLSEACNRLGVNLHWKPRENITGGIRTVMQDRYFVYYGLDVPLSGHILELGAITALEGIIKDAERFGVNVWVEAVM